MKLFQGFLENLGIISYIIPIAGITSTYTSGWNVNQNKCAYAIGSPPIAGLKNPLTPSLSVSNIKSAAANVGIATRTINDDVKNDQANNGTWPIDMSGCLHFKIVTIKLMAPSTDEIPKSFSPNIHMSAAGPGALIIEYGGFATLGFERVHFFVHYVGAFSDAGGKNFFILHEGSVERFEAGIDRHFLRLFEKALER